MDPPEPPVQTVTSVCVGSAYTPLKEDHDDHYGVPTLEELGKLSRSLAAEFHSRRDRGITKTLRVCPSITEGFVEANRVQS